MLARFERFPDPLVGEMFRLSGDIDSLFAKTFESSPLEDAEFAPPLDVTETGEEIVVMAEIPGVKRDDVKISIDKGILSIGGERKQTAPADGARGLVREQRQGKFRRTVRLPYEVNAAGVSAELSDGLLRIVLPKAEEAKPKQIDVKVK